MILNFLKRLCAIVTAFALLASVTSMSIPLASADGSGKIQISTNLALGSYTLENLSGTVVGTGSGILPISYTIPASDDPGIGYQIVFNPVVGFDTPSPYYFNLINGADLIVGPTQTPPNQTGRYHVTGSSPTGNIFVSTNLALGTYTITDLSGTTVGTGSGVLATSFSLPASDAPGVGYSIQFTAVAGFNSSARYFFNLVSDDVLNLGPNQISPYTTGDYTPVGAGSAASIVVSTNLAIGSYTLKTVGTNITVGTGSGILPVSFSLPSSDAPGTGYSIVFNDVPGFVTPSPYYHNLITGQPIAVGPNEDPVHRAGIYTPVGSSTTTLFYVATNHLSGSYKILPNPGTTPVGNGSGTAYQGFNLNSSVAGIDYRIEFDPVSGFITPATIPFTLATNDPLNPRYFMGAYSTLAGSGSITVHVMNQNNQPITDGNWTLSSCTTASPASCTGAIGNGGAENTFVNLTPGIFRVSALAAVGYRTVQILSENPHTLAANEHFTFIIRYYDNASGLFADPAVIGKTVSNATPAAGGTVTYTVNYGNLGTVDATHVLIVDDYDETNLTVSALSDATHCTDTGTEIQCNFTSLAAASSASLTYSGTVKATAITGTVISNTASVVSADDNSIVINDSASRSVTVTTPAINTVTVNQIGGTGTLNLIDPSAGTTAVTTATRTISSAAAGTWTLGAIVPPVGFVLGSVTNAAGVVITPAPYTQTLGVGNAIVYNVNYVPTPVVLPSSGNFAILSETGITNTGSHTSVITGDIGSSPITAAAMNDVYCSEITGTIFGVNAAYVGSGDQTCFAGNPPLSNKTLVDNAVLDMETAYADAAGRSNPTATELGAGNIGGMNLAPGLYKWSTDVTIPTNVTLSGNATDVWIFQIAGNLTIASGGSVPSGIKVVLGGQAKASNVFWQVGGGTGATLGTYSTFNGTILSAKQIIIQTGAVLNGRALAQTQVTLDASTVTVPTASANSVTVNQVGGTGTLNLIDPSAGTTAVTTATRTVSPAAAGAWTLGAIVPPIGFVLGSVTNAAGVAITPSPYTQTLVAGGALVFNVNYLPIAPTTATLSITTSGANGAVSVNGTLLGTYSGTALTTTVDIAAANTISFGAVAGFTTPSNIVIAANTLVAGSTNNYVGAYVATANSATITVTTMNALGAVSLNGNNLGSYNGVTPVSGIINVTAINTLSFGAVTGFTAPSNIIIPANTLVAGSTTPYVGTYVAAATATLSIRTTGANGAVTVNGTLLGTYDGVTPLTTAVSIAAINTISFGAVATFTTPLNIVIPANSLVASSTNNYVGAYVLVSNSATVTVTTVGANGAVSLNGNYLGTYNGVTPVSGIINVTAINTLSFGAVTGFTAPSNIIIPANTRVAGSTTAYVGTYVAAAVPDPAITAFALTATSAKPLASNTINYTINYGNLSGIDTVGGVTLTIDYDETHGAVIVPAPTPFAICANNTPVAGQMRCNVADLAVGGTGTLNFNYTINVGTTVGTILSQSAIIAAANGNGNLTNDTRSVTTTTLGAFTLTKTANAPSVNDNAIITYTLKIERNITQVGSINVTLSDTVTGSSAINGTAGGSLQYIPNSGDCGGVVCSSQQLNLAPITVTLDNAGDLTTPGSAATLHYQARATTAGAAATSVATNTVTATSVGFPNKTASATVALIAPPAIPGVVSLGGGGGGSSDYGNGGGYKMKKGQMKLDIQKLVSLDGVNFVTPEVGKNIALAMPENKATRLYTKLLISVVGDVSATNIKFRHFFDTGRSDMTADGINDLTGAHVDGRGLLTVDKAIVGGTATMTYSVLVHENGSNVNPAVDGLELVSFGSNLPSMQDGLTYLGFGTQSKTYLYAGKVPANADQTLGTSGSPATDLSGSTLSTLAIDVHANKPTANIGDTVTFVVTLRNLAGKDLTNVLIDHTFDANAFEVANTFGAVTDGNTIRWKQPVLRPGQEVNLSFNLKVKDTASVGALVHGLTQVLASEFENIAPFENSIRIGGAGQQMQLAQTGPAGVLGLLMVLSALAAFANSFLRRTWQMRNRRLALQAI